MAEHFDEFVISCALRFASVCPDYAGADPVATMLSMSAARLLEAGVPADTITTTGDRLEGISAALARGVPGDLVVILDDPNAAFPSSTGCVLRDRTGARGPGSSRASGTAEISAGSGHT